MASFSADDRRAILAEALSRYDPTGHYDDVFHEVSNRAQRDRELGKADLCTLICWKRSARGSFVTSLLEQPDEKVRAVTRATFAARSDEDCLVALAELPGFKGRGPLATVVLCAFDPMNFGVMDDRSDRGLTLLGQPIVGLKGYTTRYLQLLRELRDEWRITRPEATARDVDKALWVLGKPNRRAATPSAGIL